jgi:hypothetical protein
VSPKKFLLDFKSESDFVEANSANAALTKSVIKENVSAIAQDIAEMALDAALNEGLLKEGPVISWLVRTVSIGCGIRDRLFLKKTANSIVLDSELPKPEVALTLLRFASEARLLFLTVLCSRKGLCRL